jgi:hypothetical protein
VQRWRQTAGSSPGEERSVPRALLTVTVATVYIAAGLWLDRYVDRREQLLLGVLTAAVLGALLLLQPAAVRIQTLAVVGIATMGEVIGSLIWGLYTYRLENLPAFVPPGHGLVYLTGLSVATLMAKRPRILLIGAGLGAVGWGLAGVTILPAADASGAMGCAFLIAVLLWTRRPVYAGVFVAVAALEIYGTAIGTWTWQPVVPVLGMPQGNPPSGAASGYVVFDVLALALTSTAVAARWRVWRRMIRGTSRIMRSGASAARP